jgi:hypothetical protein
MVLDSKKRNRIVAGFLILLGLLIILTPWYIFPVCEIAEKSGNIQVAAGSGNDLNMNSGSHMTCWYTAEAETGSGALAILVGLVLLAWPNRESRRSLGIITIGLGVVTVLFPTYLIGTCTDTDTPCNIGTKTALIILGILTVIIGIYLVITKDVSPTVPA